MLSLNKQVVVVDYQSEWRQEFEVMKAFFRRNINIPNIQIEHIGSTSVEGLSAKPIIDIVIVVNSTKEFEKVKKDLENVEYTHVGDQGIKNREVFKLTKPSNFYHHNLYVALQGSLGLKNQLTFRNHLRKHPEDVQRYGNLKKELAKRFSFDISSYIEGKTEFIISILQQYNFDENELMEIININKK
ncbi:MAG: GrpB family protein [Firmicutes bacterium]|nr:GrpB family protein [Bacillota bacterium]